MKLSGVFRRVTTSGAFIPEIDGLRFVAIASVVLFHVLAQLNRYYVVHVPILVKDAVQNGNRGVQLFFVISGFILALPFAKRHLCGGPRVSLARYFLRRLTRLEPPFVIAMLALAILIRLTSHLPVREIAPHLLATLGYCHSLVFGQLSSIAPVAWSLEVEVQFYVLVPLLTYLFAIRNVSLRRGTIIAGMLAAGVAQTLIATPEGGRFQLSIGYNLQFFLAGFLLADLFLCRKAPQKFLAWDLVSVIGWPAVFLLPAYSVQILLPFLIPILYWAAFHGHGFNRLFRVPLVCCAGGMCYSIYLVHFAIIAAATRLVGHSNVMAMISLSLVMTVCISAVYYLLIEKPCMNPRWPVALLLNMKRLSLSFGAGENRPSSLFKEAG